MSERGAEGELARRAAELPTAPRPASRPVYTPRNANAGYWNFIAGALFLLFIFYVTGKGELAQWIEVLKWTPANAPTATGASQAPGTGGEAAGSSGVGSMGLPGAGAAGAVGSAVSNMFGGGAIGQALQKAIGFTW